MSETKIFQSKKIPGFIIYLLCIVISAISIFSIGSIITQIIKKSLSEIAIQGAHSVSLEMKGYLNELDRLSIMLINDSYSNASSIDMDILLKPVRHNKFERIGFADTKGNIITTDGPELWNEKPYIKKALNGEASVSGPFKKSDSEMVIVFTVPVYQNNRLTGALFGEKDIEILHSSIDRIRFAEKGNSFILNCDGTTIAHDNMKLVYGRDNDFYNVKSDPKLQPLVNLEKQMIQRKIGAGEYYYDGIAKYLGFAPIEGTDWSLAVAAPKSVVFEDYYRVMKTIAISLIIILLAALGMAFYAFVAKKQMLELNQATKQIIVSAGILEIEIDIKGILANVNHNLAGKLGY